MFVFVDYSGTKVTIIKKLYLIINIECCKKQWFIKVEVFVSWSKEKF